MWSTNGAMHFPWVRKRSFDRGADSLLTKHNVNTLQIIDMAFAIKEFSETLK